MLSIRVQRRRADRSPKPPIRQVLKFDFLPPPNFFESTNGCASWLGVSLLQFVNRSLGQTDPQSEFGLAPAEYGARHPDLGRKSMPLPANELTKVARVGREVKGHRATTSLFKQNPPAVSRRGFWLDIHDHAIRDRSRGAHGSGTTRCPDRPLRLRYPTPGR